MEYTQSAIESQKYLQLLHFRHLTLWPHANWAFSPCTEQYYTYNCMHPGTGIPAYSPYSVQSCYSAFYRLVQSGGNGAGQSSVPSGCKMNLRHSGQKASVHEAYTVLDKNN